jgi:hypothetical protein
MNWNDLPDIFVNRENFIRLTKEAADYRRWRNIFHILAMAGWALAGFLFFKG